MECFIHNCPRLVYCICYCGHVIREELLREDENEEEPKLQLQQPVVEIPSVRETFRPTPRRSTFKLKPKPKPKFLKLPATTRGAGRTVPWAGVQQDRRRPTQRREDCGDPSESDQSTCGTSSDEELAAPPAPAPASASSRRIKCLVRGVDGGADREVWINV